MEPETTEELLSRMEREHVPNIYHPNRCAACDPVVWPCDVGRVVAHARSLAAALNVQQERENLRRNGVLGV